jgi:hypothetical protein
MNHISSASVFAVLQRRERRSLGVAPIIEFTCISTFMFPLITSKLYACCHESRIKIMKLLVITTKKAKGKVVSILH